jgi:hypothetical protein
MGALFEDDFLDGLGVTSSLSCFMDAPRLCSPSVSPVRLNLKANYTALLHARTRGWVVLDVDDKIGQTALNYAEDASDCISGDGVDERIGPAEAMGGRCR